MYQTQDLLEKFLKEKNIEMDNVSIEKFANTISIDDKIEYCKEINAAKAETEEKLKAVDEKHENLWKQISDIGQRDWSGSEIIQNLITAYIREVEKINLDVDFDENYDSRMEEELSKVGDNE